MSVIRIASRYAKSLVDLAAEFNKLDRIKQDVDTFQSALNERDFYLMVKSPIIAADKKLSICKAIFEKSFDELTMNFLQILIRKGREKFIPEIMKEFVLQYKRINKITSVRLTTAGEISSEVVNAIKAKLSSAGVAESNIDLELVVDPEVIGGFKIETADQQYDATISNKLDNLRKEFKGNLYVSKIISK